MLINYTESHQKSVDEIPLEQSSFQRTTASVHEQSLPSIHFSEDFQMCKQFVFLSEILINLEKKFAVFFLWASILPFEHYLSLFLPFMYFRMSPN